MIEMIAAVADYNIIGVNNSLAFYMPDDMKHFVKTTRNKTVVMGSKTHEEIGIKLPNRKNIVVSRNRNYKAIKGSILVNNPANITGSIIVIGGETMYRYFLPIADKLYITEIKNKAKYTIKDDLSRFPYYKDLFIKVESGNWQDYEGIVFRFTVWRKK